MILNESEFENLFKTEIKLAPLTENGFEMTSRQDVFTSVKMVCATILRQLTVHENSLKKSQVFAKKIEFFR